MTDIPLFHRTYGEDVGDEGHRPDHVVRIHGLNETRVKRWWQEFNRHPPPWQLYSTNCARVVSLALEVAGGDDAVDLRLAPEDYLDTFNIVWTPTDVLNFALAITRGIFNRGR